MLEGEHFTTAAEAAHQQYGRIITATAHVDVQGLEAALPQRNHERVDEPNTKYCTPPGNPHDRGPWPAKG